MDAANAIKGALCVGEKAYRSFEEGNTRIGI
jgi:hypothetical protein